MNEVRHGAGAIDSETQRLHQQKYELTNPRDLLSTSFFNTSGTSTTLMMNMYHQLSQQPNMSLLNAINGITTNYKSKLSVQNNKVLTSYYKSDEYLLDGIDCIKLKEENVTNIFSENKESKENSDSYQTNPNNGLIQQDNFLKLTRPKNKSQTVANVKLNQTANYDRESATTPLIYSSDTNNKSNQSNQSSLNTPDCLKNKILDFSSSINYDPNQIKDQCLTYNQGESQFNYMHNNNLRNKQSKFFLYY
jgi:hypothetical protein